MLSVAVSVSAEAVNGRVVNERGEAMPFVTISVLANDSSLITGAITDEDGNYSLQFSAVNSQLPIIIQASYVGYHTSFGGPDFALREETQSLSVRRLRRCW